MSGLALLMVGLVVWAPVPEAPSPHLEPWTIVESETTLAVVTRRAGPAARLAHDHFVHAARYDAALSYSPDRPEDAGFRVSLRIADLRIDEGPVRSGVEARLIELGILEEPFQAISESQRGEVRAALVSEGQLDAVRHPVITLGTSRIRRTGSEPHPFEIEAEMSVRGETRPIRLQARIETVGADRVRIEAFGSSRFSDFGIEPYRAFLGAVRNRDEFHFYLELVAEAGGGRVSR